MDTNLEQEETKVKEETVVEDNSLNELNDKYLRLYSDFENYKRRTTKEKLDIIENGNEKIVKDFISIVDNFERCNEMTDGVRLIYNQFVNVLSKYNVSKLDVKGLDFNPDTMEAITSIPAVNEADKNKVADVIESCYLINSKVVRIPKVVVFK